MKPEGGVGATHDNAPHAHKLTNSHFLSQAKAINSRKIFSKNFEKPIDISSNMC
jgi:hypothetical protein